MAVKSNSFYCKNLNLTERFEPCCSLGHIYLKCIEMDILMDDNRKRSKNVINISKVKVKVSRDRPRWPKGFRVD